MKRLNCTTPFDKDKSSICEDPEVAKKALDLFESYQFQYEGQCMKPCTYLRLKVILEKQINLANEDGYLRVNFEDQVKQVKSFYRYSFLSLIAEVGGYVGLFLGVSVYQLTTVFEALYNRLKL